MNRNRTSRSPSAAPLVLAFCLAAPLLAACSGDDKEKSKGPPPPVEVLYNNGLDALNAKRYPSAADQFTSLEQNYPYSVWAVNAQIMQAYSLYLQNKYGEAITALDRFIQLHPAHRDIGYIYYLRALCFYEQIADIERDQQATALAMDALQEVVARFPDTPFATDARLKLDLCRDHLAGKEMEIGRYYQKQHLYQAAIGRFQKVVDDYQTTAHVPEALGRIVEIYLALGLKDEAKKTAAVLGYNDPGSFWYQEAYRDLASAGVVTRDGLPAPAKGSGDGFLGRAWHAIF